VCHFDGPGTQKSNNLANIILALRYVTRYGSGMIRTIRHKGLKRLHEDDDPRGVIAEHADSFAIFSRGSTLFQR
jgi:hypothetical protein